MRRAQLIHALGHAALAILLLLPTPAPAQHVTEPALKAAYIYNFARFTTWPDDVMPSGEQVVLCVLGDPSIGEALERTVKGRTLAGHALGVSQPSVDAPLRAGCHVVYVSGMTADRAGKLIAGVRDAPVLSISDLDGFTKVGGIAEFFFEHGQLRFNVHLASARRARLQISSRLLSLARTTK
jgi:hypothetical protein